MVAVNYETIWRRTEPLVSACRQALARFADPSVDLPGSDETGVALMHPKPGQKPVVLLRLVTGDGEDVRVEVDLRDVLKMDEARARRYIGEMLAGVERRRKRHRRAKSPLILPEGVA